MKRKQSIQLSNTNSENPNAQNYANSSKRLSCLNTSSLNNIPGNTSTASSNKTGGNISVSLTKSDAEQVPQIEFLESQPMNLQLKELSRKVQ